MVALVVSNLYVHDFENNIHIALTLIRQNMTIRNLFIEFV